MSGERHPGDGSDRRGQRISGLVVALGCVLFLGGFAWGAVAYQPYRVPTDSMTPTIGRDHRVLAERIDGGEVRRGDIVVFRDSVWGDMPMVKRVVGVGGDTVACCDKRGRLTIDGRAIDEPYVNDKGHASLTAFTAKVPKGRLFLLGDDRNTSVDSRGHLSDTDHGSVPRDAVSGRVEATVWPLGGIHMFDRPAAFKALPGGVSGQGPLRLILWSTGVGAVLILVGAAYGPVARRLRRGRRVPTAVREATSGG